MKQFIKALKTQNIGNNQILSKYAPNFLDLTLFRNTFYNRNFFIRQVVKFVN